MLSSISSHLTSSANEESRRCEKQLEPAMKIRKKCSRNFFKWKQKHCDKQDAKDERMNESVSEQEMLCKHEIENDEEEAKLLKEKSDLKKPAQNMEKQLKNKKSRDKKLNKLSQWFHNRFEHHQIMSEQFIDSDLLSEQAGASDSTTLLQDNLMAFRDVDDNAHTENHAHKSDLLETKFVIKQCKSNSTHDKQYGDNTSRFFGIKRNFFERRRDSSESGSDENETKHEKLLRDISCEGSSSDDEPCDCCRQKLRKLKQDRSKLKARLNNRSNWKMCLVLLNPLFMLAVFFYLLYSEITTVRTQLINQTNIRIIDHLVFNDQKWSPSSSGSEFKESIIRTEENLASTSKPFSNESHLHIDQMYDNLRKRNQATNQNSNESDIEKEIEHDDSKNKTSSYLSSFTSSETLRIPISKRNFFDSFSKTTVGKQINDALTLRNSFPFKILAILPTALSPQLSRRLHRSLEFYYAYTEGLVSSLELAQYFEHLRFPNQAQSDLSSSLNHLHLNDSDSSHHHTDKYKFLFHTNHSELNHEDHLYVHLNQRIHHRNRTMHHSQSNSLFSDTPPDMSIVHSDELFANNPHLASKKYTEYFIQTNRKRLQLSTSAYRSVQSNDHKFRSEMQLSLLPLGNSSQRLINSLCDSIELQKPAVILSLVDPTRNYYLEMLARIRDIPMITMTGEYQETGSLQKLLIEGQLNEASMQLSLDLPIAALADATFSLLKKNHWFDAILLIDDTSASDLFSYRLSQLCRQNGNRNRVNQNKHSMYDQQAKYSTFSFNNKERSIDGIKNYNRKEWIESNYEYLDSVWSRLKVIRVSKNLLQKELYMELSEIQTNHRRVVLVHCDKVTTKRVIETSKTLGLLDGNKIWILLDGVIGSQITNPSFLYDVNLPIGMMAIHQRAPSLQDSQTLFNIVRLIGETAANTLLNAQTWMHEEGNFANGSQPEVSCWQKSTSARIKYSQVVYRELKKIIDQFTYAKKIKCSNEDEKEFSNYKENDANLRKSAFEKKNGDSDDWRNNQKIDSQSQLNQKINKRRKRVIRKRNTYYNAHPSTMANQHLDETTSDVMAKLEKLWPSPIFDVLNLVPNENAKRQFNESTLRYPAQFLPNILPKIALKTGLLQPDNRWKTIGNITEEGSNLNSITFIQNEAGDRVIGPQALSKHNFRIVTATSPPFIQFSTKLINGTCLTGVPCLQVNVSDPEDLVAVFTDFNSKIRHFERKTYIVKCCEGISVDLLNAISRDLHFSYEMYLVADGLFGLPRQNNAWNGITGDLISGAAHMAFTAFSITSDRVKVIDYSVPFFYSGVSCLAQQRSSNVPIAAFLLPFSIQLWVAIISSLVLTAIAAATYEWLSPFGLNPWGRQRTKNFSIGSALWSIFSILFSHLYAFKAPKSWPSKVLLNLWGCFSVIFLASYTANVAAQFAGIFNIHEINNFHDGILMEKKTGVARSSASEGYIMKENMELWSGNVQKNRLNNLEEGIQLLREKKIDVLIGDTAILDYFRANEPACTFNLLGDSIFEDAYAIGMQRDFPLKDAISDLIMEYNAYGFLDQLQRRWYGRAPCLENSLSNLRKPKPLSVRALAGLFIMLFIGMLIGTLILICEHFLFKYGLPRLRQKDKDCFWKSPNLMFFSQKIYRFINTVELVSPHHSAKEIMSNLRTGQITSLFQKSLKRKAKEDARRRKSKYQFFEMIQEVRKVVKEQKEGREDSFEVGDNLIAYPLKQQDSLFSEIDSIGNQTNTTMRTSSIKWQQQNGNQNVDNQMKINNKERQGSVHTQNSKDQIIKSSCIRIEKPQKNVSTKLDKKSKIDRLASKDSLTDQQLHPNVKYENRKFDDNFSNSNSKLTITPSHLTTSRNSSAIKSKINTTKYSEHSNSHHAVDRFYKSPSSNLSSEFYSDKNCLLRVASNTHIDHPHLHYGSDNYGCISNEKVQHINLHSNISISLEDIALPNDSGLGVGLIKREDSSLINKKFLKKTLSFDDLKTLKNQLTYCLNSTDTANNSLNTSHCNLMMIEDNSVRNSLRSLIINSVSPMRHYNYNKFETYRNSNLTKEEIIVLWRNSERELLNTLNDVLMSKKQIEEKFIVLQRMLTSLK